MNSNMHYYTVSRSALNGFAMAILPCCEESCLPVFIQAGLSLH